MSHTDLRSHRLSRTQARKLITEIAAKYPGNIIYTKHAQEEMAADNLIFGDILNVIKSPDAMINDEPELINESYRYRLETKRIMVVIAFDSNKSCAIVTAWRK